MTNTVITRISRISFLTDMTRGDAPVVPLAFMLEGVWPGEARWLGLIGRTQLTPLELDRINLTTWPDLAQPFKFLSGLFTHGWNADEGEAGAAVFSAWRRSAVDIAVKDYEDPLRNKNVNFKDAPDEACNALLGELGKLVPRLRPVLIAPVVPIRRELPVELLDELNNESARKAA